LAGGEDGVAILDASEWKGLGVFRDPAPGVTAVAASGGLGAAAGTDGKVWIWNLAQGKVLHVLKSEAGCTHAVAFHPGGRWLASAGTDGKIRIWNPENGEEVRALQGHAGAVRALTFASGGRHLVSGGKDGVRVWDFESGKSLRTLEMAGSSAFGVAVGSTGREIVATGGDSRIWEWGGRGTVAVPEAKPPRMGFLGITYGGSPDGALVNNVTQGFPALQAGVKSGDVIVGMDGTPIEETGDLLRFMRESKEGDEVHVRIRRDGALRVLKVKLGRSPHEP
jgi:WD40 repeat protein